MLVGLGKKAVNARSNSSTTRWAIGGPPLSKQAVTKLALDEQDGPAGEVFSDGYRGFASPCDAWRRILIDPKDDLPWRGSGEV